MTGMQFIRFQIAKAQFYYCVSIIRLLAISRLPSLLEVETSDGEMLNFTFFFDPITNKLSLIFINRPLEDIITSEYYRFPLLVSIRVIKLFLQLRYLILQIIYLVLQPGDLAVLLLKICSKLLSVSIIFKVAATVILPSLDNFAS